MIKAIHIGSQSIDVHTNSQSDTNAVVNALVAAIPNLTHIVIGTYLDYDSISGNDQFAKWASSIHSVGKKMWVRSLGFNDWQGTNSVPLFITQTNYIVNPYFESDTNFWGTGGGMIKSQDAIEFFQGTHSMKLIGTTNGDSAYATFSDAGTPVVGHTYTISVYLKGSGTVTLWVYDGVSDNFSSNIVLTSSWTQYTFSVTCAAAGMLAGIRLTSSNAVTCYVDSVFWTDNSTSPDTFTNHCKTNYTTFINNNYSSFLSGDIFEALPDEPENCPNWATIYGGLGTSPGAAAYNTFITDSITAANTAFANHGLSGVITGYVHTSPSATHDVITQATANSLTADGTDDYPETGLTLPTDMKTAMISEINTWLISAHTSPNRPKHITFGPSVYNQLSQGDQAFALLLEYTQLVQMLAPQGITIWQFGATDNSPKSRLFDWSGSVWVARNAATTVRDLFSGLINPVNIYSRQGFQ